MMKAVFRLLPAVAIVGLLLSPMARAQKSMALAPLSGIGGMTWQSETDTVAGRPILLQIEGNRLVLYSLDNPVAPVPIGSLVSPYALVRFHLHRDIAYVIASQFNQETDWLIMVDYSDPAAPKEIARKGFQALGLALGFQGNHLYLSHKVEGLKVFDIADPAAMKDVTGWTNLVYPTDMALQGNRLYLTESGRGFSIFDVAIPTQPRKIGEYVDAQRASQGRIAVTDTLALVDFYRGIQLVSVKDPMRPRLIKDVDINHAPARFLVRGGLAYVVTQYNFISIIDISEPDSAEVIGTQRDGGDAVHIAFGGNHLYASSFDDGMQIVSISDPASPALVRTIASPYWTGDFRFSGNTLYLGSGWQGIQVFDMENPVLPRRLASLESVGQAEWIETFRDEIAFAGSNSSNLKVIDIKDRAAPKVVDSIELGPGWLVQGLGKAGDHLFVGTRVGLQVYRVAAGQPVTMVYADAPRADAIIADTRALEIRGNLALMARGVLGLQLADVSDPEKPVYLGRLDKLGSAVFGLSHFAWHGNLVYTQDSAKGMALVDVSDPSKPVRVGSFPDLEYAMDFLIWKNHLLVPGNILNGASGLCIFDITDPLKPVREKVIPIRDLAGEFQSMRIVGDRLYLSHSGTGLRIYDLSEETVTVQPVRAAAENRPEAVSTGRFMRQAGGIRRVFDALGRLLAP